MEKDIGRINKNDTTDIVIRVDDFGGVKGLTVREFVTSDRYTGFTKSGVRILASDFPKFKEMINSITEEDMADSNSQGSKAQSSQKTSKKDPNQETLDAESEEGLPDY